MTNRLSNQLKEQMISSAFTGWPGSNLVIYAVNNTYTFSATHDFLDDVPAGARIHSENMVWDESSGGRAYHQDGPLNPVNILFTPIPAGSLGMTLKGFWIYQSGGASDAVRPLLAWIDTTIYGAPISHVVTSAGFVLEWNVLSGVFGLNS